MDLGSSEAHALYLLKAQCVMVASIMPHTKGTLVNMGFILSPWGDGKPSAGSPQGAAGLMGGTPIVMGS